MIRTIKSCWKFLKPVGYIALIAFFGCVYMHDDGIPESLDEAQKKQVVEVATKMEGQLGEIIKRFEDFIANPELESEMIGELLAALEEHYPSLLEASTNPAFFVSCEETLDVEKRILHKSQQLEEISMAAVHEIVRRVDLGIHDQDRYDQLAFELEKMGRIEGGPCDRSECFWCRCKNWGK